MASSGSVKGVSGAIGPNGSSVISFAWSDRPVMMVGEKKLPGLFSRAPPNTISPPCERASSTNACMTSMRRACASGPICVALSRPSPTLVELMISMNLAAKRS